MKFFFAMACVLGIATCCFAQNADTNAPTRRMSGIQSARAAALRALKAQDQSSAEVPPATASLITGTFAFTITINLHSGFPTQDKIYCSITTGTNEGLVSSSGFSADGYVAATISGSTATCSVSLKYGWWLATPTTDTVFLGVDITTIYGTTGTVPYYINGSTWGSTLAGVPASGSTTAIKVTSAL